jgi:hypothetical protein
MNGSGHALLTFWQGRFPLAASVESIAQVLPIESMASPTEDMQAFGLLGRVQMQDTTLPVVSGYAALGSFAEPELGRLLVLKQIPLAVAVTRVGEILALEAVTAQPLPPWLAQHAALWGIEGAVEAQGLWFLLAWQHTPLNNWLQAWQTIRSRP